MFPVLHFGQHSLFLNVCVYEYIDLITFSYWI